MDLWRSMVQGDLGDVERIAEEVHPDYPEDAAVLAERQRLYPRGCFVFGREAVQGYAVAHPWRLGQPPQLNTRLHRLPDDADTFHIHDVAILPAARGGGMGAAIIPLLRAEARATGLGCLSLVAVGHSLPFWTKHGFEVIACDALASYGRGACAMVLR